MRDVSERGLAFAFVRERTLGSLISWKLGGTSFWCRAYKLVMDAAEQYVGFAPEDLAKIKELRQREYRSMLLQEAVRPDPYRAAKDGGNNTARS